MCIRNAFSAVAGTIVVFAWTCASWMFLTWHHLDMKSFKKEGQVVTESIKVEAIESGIYVVPNFSADTHKTPEAQKAWSDKAKKGPFIFMSVSSTGQKWDMNTALAIQFATQLLVALGAAWLLSRSSLTSILGRGFFVCIAVTLGTILFNVGNWNWWGFPLTTTLVNIADVAVGWLLGGIVMAAIHKKKA